jgi:hypothetical protein
VPVELRFVQPSLVELDDLDTEVLACTMWSDVRPAHGLAGLCDFRLAGRLSQLVRKGFVTGAPGEVVMVPGKPRLSFDKLLLFGAGDRARFDEASFRSIVSAMLSTMEGLAARIAVVELPGRHDELIAADRAADILLLAAGGKREHDVWTLVENSEGKQRIVQHMIEERRRVRRVL